MHSLKRAFFWLSGAGTETLEQCPAWEQRKYVAFGATVLVPCAFAFIACAYALSTLTEKASIIYPVAAVWAFIILTIDRALLAGYRAYASFFRKISQFFLRLVVAVLMGITIAHPLVLLLFRDTISRVVEKERAAEIEVTPQYAKLQSELGFWQAEFERELNGQRSGLRGEGPRARSIRADQLEPRRGESQRLGSLLEHLTAEKSTLQTQSRQAEASAIQLFETKLAEIATTNRTEAGRVAGLKQQVESDQAGQFVTQQNALRETIKHQIDTRLAELTRVQGELANVASEEVNRLAALRAEPRRDILTQTLALHALFQAGSAGGQFAFYTYLVLTLLFMLVDTIPLIVKFFTKPGPYDTLVDRDEITFDTEHRAFRDSRTRYMTQLSSGNLTAVTRNPRLESALVDGVEHTRAAREFLDSLVEMERSFAAKMTLEEQNIGVAESDKRAAFEAIKRRFYDDLHHRMEIFFTTRHA